MKSVNMTDGQLIENIKRDDYASYNHLFMRYYSRLCLFVVDFIGRNEGSEDIVQELFIKLWTNRKKIIVQNTVSGYLHQAAKNMSLNYIRSEIGRRTAIDKMRLADRDLPDEDGSEYEEFGVALDDCIGRLPARSKEVLLMHRMEGMKQKEIAEKLNISLQTIKNQIWVSMQRLKDCLEAKGTMK